MGLGKTYKGYLVGVTAGFLLFVISKYYSFYTALLMHLLLACLATWIVSKIEGEG